MFQRMMDGLLQRLPFVRVYIDDIVIYSKTKEVHFIDIHEVLKLLKEYGLKIKLKESYFAMPEIVLLGHIVDNKGVLTDIEKIGRIRNLCRSKTKRQLRSFVGLASYYRRLIKEFARIARPLHEKTSAYVHFS